MAILYAPQDNEDPDSPWVYHAIGFGACNEFSACSLAVNDEFDIDPVHGRLQGQSFKGYQATDKRFKQADPKQKAVTCPYCIKALDTALRSFRKNRKGEWIC